MSVIFNQEAEDRRHQAVMEGRAKKPKYELFSSTSEAEAVRFARDNGWAEKKVQVKAYRTSSVEWEYHVEPFEKDCRCPNLLKYADYFGPTSE